MLGCRGAPISLELTPLKSFEGNFCTSAMMSFQTTPDAPDCGGTAWFASVVKSDYVVVKDLKSLAPPPET